MFNVGMSVLVEMDTSNKEMREEVFLGEGERERGRETERERRERDSSLQGQRSAQT